MLRLLVLYAGILSLTTSCLWAVDIASSAPDVSLQDQVHKMMSMMPHERDVHERTDALEHPFLQDQNLLSSPAYVLHILVSFSMSPEALRSLAEQSARLARTIEFRGFYHNDIQQTQRLLGQWHIAALIDPRPFRWGHVSQVPCFMLVRMDDGHVQVLSQVKGLVNLDTALDFMQRNTRDPWAQKDLIELLQKVRHES